MAVGVAFVDPWKAEITNIQKPILINFVFAAYVFFKTNIAVFCCLGISKTKEVDEDARERAKEQARRRRLEEDKKHNKGQFGDLARTQGLALCNCLVSLVARIWIPTDASEFGSSMILMLGKLPYRVWDFWVSLSITCLGDAMMPLSLGELLASQGMVLVQEAMAAACLTRTWHLNPLGYELVQLKHINCRCLHCNIWRTTAGRACRATPGRSCGWRRCWRRQGLVTCGWMGNMFENSFNTSGSKNLWSCFW